MLKGRRCSSAAQGNGEVLFSTSCQHLSLFWYGPLNKYPGYKHCYLALVMSFGAGVGAVVAKQWSPIIKYSLIHMPTWLQAGFSCESWHDTPVPTGGAGADPSWHRTKAGYTLTSSGTVTFRLNLSPLYCSWTPMGFKWRPVTEPLILAVTWSAAANKVWGVKLVVFCYYEPSKKSLLFWGRAIWM